ncbi:GTPase-associated protein 1-related protein [Streptomyces sp. PmtG]
MAIRRLSYRLAEEPVTGAVRLIPVPAPAPGSAAADPSGPGGRRQVREWLEWVELAIGTGHDRDGDGHGLSYSRLPDGGSLLCATAGGPGVEAVHYTGTDRARLTERWPIASWSTVSWPTVSGPTASGPTAAGDAGVSGAQGSGEPGDAAGPGDEIAALGGVGRAELVAFARAHPDRLAPFLADVRRLFDDPAGRQLIVAEEHPDTVARWIALACASLPATYVPSLTFTTRAADPARAPQHIVGIGPDAAFDRRDATALEHFYRVHDGLGGPGSPPRPDPWATWAARLWLAGEPLPRTDAEPFAPGPLVSRLVRGGHLSGAELAGLGGDASRAAVDVLVTALDLGRADPAGLTVVCHDLHARAPSAAAPLALALARHRVAAAPSGEQPAELGAALAALPVDAEGERLLRGEFGGGADVTLRRALRDPVDTWTEPLRRALATGDDESAAADAAVKLARCLRDPTGVERGPAVRVLDDVGSAPLTRRVLQALAADPHPRRLDLLRELADSPDGDWLRRNLDERSPVPLCLAVAAAHWRDGGRGPRGIELFAKLTEVLPSRMVTSADTLRQMWWLVWGSGCPDPAELSWVARTCTVRLLIEAGFGTRVTGLLSAPDGVDRELVAFARDLLHERHLSPRQRATAELLVLAQDLVDRRKALHQGIRRFEALYVDAAPLDVTVRRGVFRLVARALARADAGQQARPPVYDHLIAAGPELLTPYRAFMLDEGRREQLTQELTLRPDEIAACYSLWRPSRRPGISQAWRDVAAELLAGILAPVAAGLSDPQLSDVADLMMKGQSGVSRVQEWNAWRNSLRAH